MSEQEKREDPQFRTRDGDVAHLVFDEEVEEWRQEAIESVEKMPTLPGLPGAMQSAIAQLEITATAVRTQTELNKQRGSGNDQ